MDTKNFAIAANAHVRKMPEGATVPQTFAQPAWPTDAVHMGAFNDKGITISVKKGKKGITTFNEFFPVLYIATEAGADMAGEFQEWLPENVADAFGGGEWTTTGSVAKFTPARPEVAEEVACLAFDWMSQGYHFRFVILRAQVETDFKANLAKSEESTLPLKWVMLGSEDGSMPFYLLTDHPAFVTPAGE